MTSGNFEFYYLILHLVKLIHAPPVKGSVNHNMTTKLSTHLDLLCRFTEKNDNSNTFLTDRILTDDE